MSNDLIVEIPPREWTRLRDLYAIQKRHACGYNLLQSYIDWVEQNAEVDVKIFSFDSEWQNHGTFMAIDHNRYVYCNTLNEDVRLLTVALNSLEQIQPPQNICDFQDRLLPAIQQHFIEMGADFEPTTTFWYHLPKEQALTFTNDQPKKGFSLARLQIQHADLVNSIWPHRSDGSLEFIQRLIRYNDSVGLFDAQEALVGWCLILPLGSIGLLQVMESHKHQGFGSIMVRYMSKLIASKDLEVTAPVVHTNVASRALFEKLGFRAIDKVHWAVKTTKAKK